MFFFHTGWGSPIGLQACFSRKLFLSLDYRALLQRDLQPPSRHPFYSVQVPGPRHGHEKVSSAGTRRPHSIPPRAS